ncbi:EF-hand domain-containing protein [Mariniflexile sp.]|uniref:EF-hand domain-containing protein n=1 Tax=Mariniflexile sp. TaxID=1979402 RepID=UPI00356A5308
MKSNKLKAGIILGMMAFLFTMTSNAQSSDKKQQKPPTTAELIKQMDANEDGKLSLEEVKGPLKESFTKIDTNEDGFLSKEELDKAPKPERKERK